MGLVSPLPLLCHLTISTYNLYLMFFSLHDLSLHVKFLIHYSIWEALQLCFSGKTNFKCSLSQVCIFKVFLVGSSFMNDIL